jgi:hypothetical protein
MLHSIFNSLFSCSHQRTTFPITPGRKAGFSALAATRSNTYVVCLDCGKEFAYDWQLMKIGAPVTVPVATAEAQPVYR